MSKYTDVLEVVVKVVDNIYKNGIKYYIAKTTIAFEAGDIVVQFGEGQTRHCACQNAFDTAMSKLHIPAYQIEDKVWFSD